MTPTPEIMAGIRRDQAETDKAEKAKGRGRGNAHRLGEAHERIFTKAAPDVHEEASGDPTMTVCSICGCPTDGWCPHHGEVILVDGRTFEEQAEAERERQRAEEAARPKPVADRMVHDNVNIRSWSSGCSRHQVADFNRKFGHMGVKFLPNGQAEYRDCAAQRRVYRERGLFLKDDTQSPQNV